MWNSTKSAKLSLICNRIVIILTIVVVIMLPKIVKMYIYMPKVAYYLLKETPFLIILYLCCVPAIIALISLDRLLLNITKDEVFIRKNVKLLRIISWSCFLAAAICVFACYYDRLFIIIGVFAAFMGLIIRVVKNVIEKATEIKEENDFTI